MDDCVKVYELSPGESACSGLAAVARMYGYTKKVPGSGGHCYQMPYYQKDRFHLVRLLNGVPVGPGTITVQFHTTLTVPAFWRQ